MAKMIKAKGDTWRGKVSERPHRCGYQTVVFFCASNGQRPYRVVEVPTDQLASQSDLDALSEGELLDLFRESHSMGFPPRST
jgi:hypothetical protein